MRVISVSGCARVICVCVHVCWCVVFKTSPRRLAAHQYAAEAGLACGQAPASVLPHVDAALVALAEADAAGSGAAEDNNGGVGGGDSAQLLPSDADATTAPAPAAAAMTPAAAKVCAPCSKCRCGLFSSSSSSLFTLRPGHASCQPGDGVLHAGATAGGAGDIGTRRVSPCGRPAVPTPRFGWLVGWLVWWL